MAAGISLAGCASTSTKFATVEEFCNGLPKQEYAVEGKTKYDQPWIDDTSEAITAGCNRERPKQRPPEFDTVEVPHPKPKPPALKPPKKKLRARLRELVS